MRNNEKFRVAGNNDGNKRNDNSTETELKMIKFGIFKRMGKVEEMQEQTEGTACLRLKICGQMKSDYRKLTSLLMSSKIESVFYVAIYNEME